ncbi:thermonuclease family protein, partial [Helicobacter sp. WB40]|uniref:thermonuclease family protein n=1 Tax=Helicobacter sp. WB40 TaxID=3004130 RepID=UPI0022EBA864
LKQEYGKEAKEELQKMCKNKKAKVEFKGIDRYKRHLGVLYCDKRNVNKTLLQNGYAWSYNNWNKKLEI